MAKQKTVYVCTACGYESPKWNGRCPDCGEWNTLEESLPVAQVTRAAATPSSAAVRDISQSIKEIGEIDAADREIRWTTGLGELDRVLGGGVVKGSLILLGGEPGIGKSTLL